ncbi:Imm48 family immunity protein [Priestia megaterium]|uniref:Imm48 family immunity protein n=1 Tax=Priestia megaterium TaxID=1404 RepID=UPI0026E3C16B|nr:Imm48 family immunity protein [Priestia megaterium]MDO6848730.1 Imm48 family immunity protein [Priestia megaterium]
MEENKDFLNECISITNTTIDKVFKIDSNDEQEKQILGAYLFGMFNGLGHEKNSKPVDIQGAIIQILSQNLHYSLDSAVQFSQFLINSTDKDFHPTMFAIIHRGLEGYFMYKNGGSGKLSQYFCDIIEVVKAATGR